MILQVVVTALGILEPFNDASRHNCVLDRLINLLFQILGQVSIVADGVRDINEFLRPESATMHAIPTEGLTLCSSLI